MSWVKGQYMWVRTARQGVVILVIKKSLGKAVVRNRLKRRLRALYRESADHRSLVILPRPDAVKAKYSHLGLELKRLLAKLEQET